MKEKDVKLLWGRAASRCGICRIELSQDAKAGAAFVLGEHAHIVAESADGPRGESPLTPEERDSYHNRILLCPNHHTEIDKNEADWPVEKLHLSKSTHELWVKENLGESTDTQLAANQLAISSLVDDVVASSHLQEWNDWVARAYGYDARLRMGMFDGTYDFRLRVAAALVPDEFEEIGRSASTIAILLLKFHDTFMQYVDVRDDHYRAEKFYKTSGLWNPNYHEDLERYRKWTDEYSDLLVEATKAVNWFADLVRRDLNPTFLIEHGKFMVRMGLGIDFNNHATIPEFTDDEKKTLPDGL